MNSAERKAYLLSIPWIRELAKPVPCEGIKWKKVALKHLYSMRGRPAEGIPESAHCSFNARYRYTASRRREDYGKTGNFCQCHIISNLSSDWRRYDEWRKSQEAQND